MAKVQCKCGKTEMNFKSLSQKDFPAGWETDCCSKSQPMEKIEEKQEKALEQSSLQVEEVPKPKKSRKPRKKKEDFSEKVNE